MDSKQTIEEAKILDEILKRTAMREDETIDERLFILLLSGMMAETLIEYEEPDAVMEQSFHRISQLLHVTPVPDNLAEEKLSPPSEIDLYSEAGREIAREAAERLEGGLQDVHEIIIAITYNELPKFEEDGVMSVPESLRIMIESVIQTVVFEMATQEFADVLIEDFIDDGWPITDVLLTLGAACGYYYSQNHSASDDNVLDEMVSVMSREAMRNGMTGSQLWRGLDSANDDATTGVTRDVTELVEVFDEFFDLVGLDNNEAQAVSVAKTGGRMAALLAGVDMSIIQPSLAKVLLKTGLKQGMSLPENNA